MVEPSETDWPPPRDWQKFERWVRDLFEAEWESRATMHGRSGQPQHGVDIYGRPKGGADWHGIQCKRVSRWAGKRVSAASLSAEVNKAKGFTPKLSHFILAITGPRDAEIQRVARDITQRRQAAGLFSVEILFWEDFLDMYDRHHDVFSQHYGQVLPRIGLERRAERVDQILASTERTPAPCQLRPPPADFTGRRREIDQVLEHVRETGATITCVWGLAGVGKTSFARSVAERLRTRYADGQIEIDMQGTSGRPLSAEKAMEHAIEALGGEVPTSERMLAGAYLSALADRHALLLLDNAASAEQVGPLVPPKQCGLLVTSRRHFLLPGAQVINLKSLPDSDAKDFMLRIAPRVSDSVSRAIDLCGCLPLALRLVASRPSGPPRDRRVRLPPAA